MIRSPGKVIICFLKRDRLHKGRLREENEVGEGKQVGKQSTGRTRRLRRYMGGKGFRVPTNAQGLLVQTTNPLKSVGSLGERQL